MTPIPGAPGYYLDYPDIIGPHHKPLKEWKGSVRLSMKGRYEDHRKWKLVWCAEHNVDIHKVPSGYTFYEEGGVVKVDTFSATMSRIVRQHRDTVKVKVEDYEYIRDYCIHAIDYLNGVEGADLSIFRLLNSRRDELIKYARRAVGGVSREKAIAYTDEAIFYTWNLIKRGCHHVPNPMGSMMGRITHLIRTNRKKRAYEH